MPMYIVIGLFLAMLQVPGGAPVRPGIGGIIVRQDNGAPVGKATVVLTTDAPDFRPLQTVSSAADGQYSFDDVPAGRYRIVATRTGFVRAEYGDREGNGCGATITLLQGQRLVDTRIGMMAASAIAGRLLDQDGEPAASVGVQALRYSYQNGRRMLETVQTAETNDLGEYRLFGLAPGRYHIAAALENSGPQGALRVVDLVRQTVPNRAVPAPAIQPPPPPPPGLPQGGAPVFSAALRTPDSSLPERFVPTFYPGVADPQTASPVELRPGESFLRADMRLNLVRTRRVRGRLAGVAIAERPRSFTVSLIPRMELPISNRTTGRNASISPDGSFELAGVLPGSYFLTAAGNDNAGRVFGRVALDVGDRDFEGIAVPMSKGTTLTGRVIADDPAALQRVQTVSLRPLNETASANLNLSAQIREGRFRVEGIPPGEYLAGVTFTGPGGMYMKAMRMDSQDVRNGLRLDGQTAAELEMEIGTRGAIAEGIVVDDRQQPVASATVVLVPDTFLRQRSTLYKTASTDREGRFRMETLAPGDYKLFAWEAVERGAWEDPLFLRPIEARGRSVTLRDGGLEVVQLSAIPSNGAIYGQCDGRIR